MKIFNRLIIRLFGTEIIARAMSYAYNLRAADDLRGPTNPRNIDSSRRASYNNWECMVKDANDFILNGHKFEQHSIGKRVGEKPVPFV